MFKFIRPRLAHTNKSCRWGHCIVHTFFCQGGGSAALRQGICPACGGPIYHRLTGKFHVLRGLRITHQQFAVMTATIHKWSLEKRKEHNRANYIKRKARIENHILRGIDQGPGTSPG